MLLYCQGNQPNPSASTTLATFTGCTAVPIPTGGSFAHALCKVKLYLTADVGVQDSVGMPTSAGLVNSLILTVPSGGGTVELELDSVYLPAATSVSMVTVAGVTGNVYGLIGVSRKDGVNV